MLLRNGEAFSTHDHYIIIKLAAGRTYSMPLNRSMFKGLPYPVSRCSKSHRGLEVINQHWQWIHQTTHGWIRWSWWSLMINHPLILTLINHWWSLLNSSLMDPNGSHESQKPWTIACWSITTRSLSSLLSLDRLKSNYRRSATTLWDTIPCLDVSKIWGSLKKMMVFLSVMIIALDAWG